MDILKVKERLDREVKSRDSSIEISKDKPDPLLIAHRYRDEYISLISALFAYGKASQIVKFLDSLDFSLLDSDSRTIENSLLEKKYRFQNSQDIIEFFKALSKMKKDNLSLQDIFHTGYRDRYSVLDGIGELIKVVESYSNSYQSRGYRFLLGTPPKEKLIGQSPYKRWNMFLRWMVREDSLDMGLWSGIDRSHLLMPLDTHTFNISRELGLLHRRTYDLKAVAELTEKLKEFDPEDPVKYDFAIYRIGQEGLLDK